MGKSAEGSLRDALRVPPGRIDLATLDPRATPPRALLDPRFPRPDLDVERLTKALASPN